MTAKTDTHQKYYVPEESRIPIVFAFAALIAGFGAANAVAGYGTTMLYVGLVAVIFTLAFWWSTVTKESQAGLDTPQLNNAYVYGMAWFIFSEVMFFFAFFGALFYIRSFAVPWLGGEGAKGIAGELLWPEFEATWPPMITPEQSLLGENAAVKGPDENMYLHSLRDIGSWLPLWNTVVLLSSSGTVHIAHMALKQNNKKRFNFWLGVTVTLAFIFVILQAVEYYEAYSHLGLTLESGVYGTTFFMLTGFHGMHVLIGGIFLLTQLVRSSGYKHFSDKEHFGFEAASWYWHFVDVVWVCLFLFVYIL
ncbi:MAG: cytochrome c oxidase subunit 3 [Proteobacteria bacterium]|nr:cytochrome c oxidase subunit 3 [Pseudomonadota bacterium]MDA0899626.1 cytochrome c oxidase subunit 3 [Pseudomonadota bacterium]MDA1056312.1 cytochrome c oxidase subunit 3 [Pseudomonadota bacterium]